MFRKDQFGIVFNSLFSLVFAAAMTAFSLFMRNALSFSAFITGLVPAFAINFVLGSYIPLVKIGNAFAGLFTKKENSPVFYLLRILAIVVIMTVSMCFLVLFSAMGPSKEMLFAFLGSIPFSLLFAYPFAAIIFPFLFKLTGRLCSRS